MAAPAEEPVEIDDSLYSRQRYVYGDEAMKRMAKSNILVSGLGGLGVEIAKDIALAGVKTLTLHDSQLATLFDLSSQFFLSEHDIGKNRAEISAGQIAELNPYVKIDTVTGDLEQKDLSFFDKFQCVVLTDAPLRLQIKVNEYCRSKGIVFLGAELRGLYGWLFADFGNNFSVWDEDGEEYEEVFVETITKDAAGVVTCHDKTRHLLETNDVVVFSEVQGMVELNSPPNNVQKVEVISPTQFKIGDTSNFSDYKMGGIIRRLKVEKKHSGKSLRESLLEPQISISDFAKYDKYSSVHIGMQALHAFYDLHGKLPAPWDEAQAAEVLELAKKINAAATGAAKAEPLDEYTIGLMARTATGSLVGLAGYLGGTVAQEAMKSVTGKFTPLRGWSYYDVSEFVPPPPPEAGFNSIAPNFVPRGNRYDGQTICIGHELSSRLLDLKVFMIGAGAIGCEMMKNFAMYGIGAGPNGMITVTDNDNIEKSNLNRQFLFRPKDLQQPKSTTAARAAQKMNPALKVNAALDKVGRDTEDKYSDDFFREQTAIVNALDNVPARLYVDSRCVANQRPLLDSGTLGTKGHVQVVLPFCTQSYGSTRDPPEKDVPMCTLKSFPANIEHSIQWGRDKFQSLFYVKPAEIRKFFEDGPTKVIAELTDPNTNPQFSLVKVLVKMIKSRPTSYEDCAAWARLKFEQNFHNKIVQLLHTFPLDMRTKDGTPFWAPPRRPPTPLRFDPAEPLHVDFVTWAAALWARVWNVEFDASDPARLRDRTAALAAAVSVPVFKPKQNKHIESDPNAPKESAQAAPVVPVDDTEWKQALEELTAVTGRAEHAAFLRLNAQSFEKDDDSNFHIDFITASSNLRATNYNLQTADRLKTKRIAGRIIPAIATTTAVVSGLASLELLKIALGKQAPWNLAMFRNAYLNLGVSSFVVAEPAEAVRTKMTEQLSYTLWDRWDVNREELQDITLQQFINHFKERYGLEVVGVFQDVQMIYVPMFPSHAERLPIPMRRLLKHEKGQKYVDVVVSFQNEKGDDVNGPSVRFFFPKVVKKRVVKKK